MQRVAWTDERLDEMSRRMDAGFDRVDRDIHALRQEMQVQAIGLRNEMQAGFAELRRVTWRFGGAILGAVVISMILHGI